VRAALLAVAPAAATELAAELGLLALPALQAQLAPTAMPKERQVPPVRSE
jgi:hypothetical protein